MRRRPEHTHTPPADAAVTVRFATEADLADLERLAEYESEWVPVGPALVADVDGQLVAALSLRTGMVLSDAYFETTDLVRLLKLRKAQLRGAARGGPWLRGSRRRARSSA